MDTRHRRIASGEQHTSKQFCADHMRFNPSSGIEILSQTDLLIPFLA